MSQQMQVFNQQPGMPPPPPGAPIGKRPIFRDQNHEDLGMEDTFIAVTFMQAPPSMPGCPAGLEYLTQVDQLAVKQQKSILEAVTDWEVSNKYVLLNSAGQQVYFAYEESGCCMRQCCASNRGFTMHIVDNFQREVLTIRRPFKCCTSGCLASIDCCGHEVSIETPQGEKIGMVRQRFSCCANNFSVLNGDESKEIFKISGPNMCSWTYNCNCCADKVFEIESTDGRPCGAIKKKWRGFVTESFTQADLFYVEFPMDLDVKCKAALLGATFLIDFLQFENKQENLQNGN